jgi:hypothetical protein
LGTIGDEGIETAPAREGITEVYRGPRREHTTASYIERRGNID